MIIPLEALTVPFPDTLMSPPVFVPAAVLFPAFKTIAPVYPVVAFVLEFDDIVSVTLISPVKVSIKIAPVEKIPVGFTRTNDSIHR